MYTNHFDFQGKEVELLVSETCAFWNKEALEGETATQSGARKIGVLEVGTLATECLPTFLEKGLRWAVLAEALEFVQAHPWLVRKYPAGLMALGSARRDEYTGEIMAPVLIAVGPEDIRLASRLATQEWDDVYALVIKEEDAR